jgi:hypothetical protein
VIVTSRNIYGEEMRITEMLLRRIIREELLSEAPPLLDIEPFENPLSQDRSAPSIGHLRARSRRPKYRKGGYEEIAREIMRDTKDSWVIVTLSDFRYSSQVSESDEFKAWLKEKSYPPGTRILVVAGTPVKGDYKTPDWQIAHDIFGHSIEHEWNRYRYGHGAGLDTTIEKVTAALHRLLPKSMQLAKSNGDDIIPDILSAIVLERFDLETAMQVVGRLTADKDEKEKPYYEKLYTKIVTALFDSVDSWLTNHTDENGVIIATPF